MEIGEKYIRDYKWYFDYLRRTTEKRDVVVYLKQLIRECKLHFKALSDGTVDITCIGGGSGDADVEIIDELHNLGFNTRVNYIDPSELMFKLFLGRLADKGFEDCLNKVILKPFEKAHFIPKSDVLLCLNAIYYIKGIENEKVARKILKKMYRSLKKGGFAVIVVQSQSSPHYILRRKAKSVVGKETTEISGKYLYDILQSMKVKAFIDTIESRLDVTRIFRKGKIFLDEINKNILSLALRQDWDDIPENERSRLLSEIEKMTVTEGNKKYMKLLYDIIIIYKPKKNHRIPHNPFEEIDVVDGEDRVVGKTIRLIAHMKGVLHREVGIFLFTKAGKLITSIRGADGRYDFSSSGHIPAGHSPMHTIVKECQEELGVNIDPDKLKFVFKKELVSVSPPKINRRIFYLYTYPESIDLEDIKKGPEVRDVVEISIDDLLELGKKDPNLFSKGFLATLREYKRVMDGEGETILIKIGGSVLNPKMRGNERLNRKLIRDIAKVIRKYWPYKRFVIVLGGGHIGHVLTIKTRRKCTELNYSRNYLEYEEMINKVARIFYKERLPVYKMRYSALYFDKVDGKLLARAAEEALDHGLIPLFYADWVKTKKGMKVLSSDEIMKHLARNMKAKMAVFLTDVDGVYGKHKKLIPEIMISELKSIECEKTSDATGGMKKKLLEIKSIPVQSIVVNGYHPERLESIIEGKRTVATYIIPK